MRALCGMRMTIIEFQKEIVNRMHRQLFESDFQKVNSWSSKEFSSNGK